jgi:hypothetical protein
MLNVERSKAGEELLVIDLLAEDSVHEHTSIMRRVIEGRAQKMGFSPTTLIMREWILTNKRRADSRFGEPFKLSRIQDSNSHFR